AAGPSVEIILAPAGRLYKNTTGAKQAIQIVPTAGAGTGVAGTLEVAVTFFVEMAAGSPA
ncbi:MAG: hypothetical protein ABI242_10855, partial [Caulobacteraceae bacterium]